MSGRGLELSELPPGSVLDVQTQNSVYTIVKDADENFYIQGHIRYCPRAIATRIHGCTFGGLALMVGQLSEGRHLEFEPLEGRYTGHTITTSRIERVRFRGDQLPQRWERKPTHAGCPTIELTETPGRVGADLESDRQPRPH
jgi:hypothetical protein